MNGKVIRTFAYDARIPSEQALPRGQSAWNLHLR